MANRDVSVNSLDRARLAFGAALARRDATSAAELYAEDAQLSAPLIEIVEGRAEIRDFWQAGIDAGIDGMVVEPIAFTELDEIAYELGRYSISVGMAQVVERGRYVTVHRRVGSEWQRSVEMFASDQSRGEHG